MVSSNNFLSYFLSIFIVFVFSLLHQLNLNRVLPLDYTSNEKSVSIPDRIGNIIRFDRKRKEIICVKSIFK